MLKLREKILSKFMNEYGFEAGIYLEYKFPRKLENKSTQKK